MKQQQQKRKQNVRIITDNDKKESEKKKKEAAVEEKHKLDIIFAAIANNIASSNLLTGLNIQTINISEENSMTLAAGLKKNETLKKVVISNCLLSSKAFDLIAESFLEHPSVEELDFSSNQLNDKNANMISRIITRQTQKRDQIYWSHGLRNEKPLAAVNSKGLLYINLDNNQLTFESCEPIANALSYDNYIRKLSLRENNINELGCSEFNKLLKSNISLLNIDLRKNPGFITKYEQKIHLKLAKNILFMFQTNNEDFKLFSKYICPDYFNSEIPKESKIKY